MTLVYRSGDAIPGTQYRYVREIGAGGHGCVYLVEHTFLESQAVMKLLHGDLIAQGDLAARMTREARTLAKLRHPNVVEVRDGGLTNEPAPRPYFVMEQLNGMSLRDMLRKTRRGLGVLPSLRIVTDILVGLDHAHNAGVIHRDIKPDNVYLHRTPSSVTIAKILDFGIAHLLLGQRYTGRYFLGTPRYAAPEQLRGETPSPRTDVYAAGLVLHELLTGESPFSSIKDIGALLNAHLNDALPKPSLSNPDVPLTLDRFLESMLAKDPEERPPTAFAAAVALREIRSRFESDQSDSIHAPEFQTEPSPMEDVLFAASPDDLPIVTEVAPPLGINDTTPDSAPQMASLRAALREGSDPSTTAPSPQVTRPDAGRAAQLRTVPMAAPVREKPGVDRAARTNTARARTPSARPGPNDTARVVDLDLGIADTTPAAPRGTRRSSPPVTNATTNQPLVVSRHDEDPRSPASTRARRRTILFGIKLLGTALLVGGAAVTVTALAVRASRDRAAAAGDNPAPAYVAPSSPPLAPVIESAPASVVAPVTAPRLPPAPDPSSSASGAPRAAPRPTARKMPPSAAPPPSAIPFD